MVYSTLSTTAQVKELQEELKTQTKVLQAQKGKLKTQTKVLQAQNRTPDADANTNTANIAPQRSRKTTETAPYGTVGTSS